MLFEVDGFRVITDPILTSRVVHLRRRVEVPTIDPVDVVLISHLHMDHLHLRSLRTVWRGARLVAPAGAAKLFRSLDVTALDEVVAGDIVTLREPTADAPGDQGESRAGRPLQRRGPALAARGRTGRLHPRGRQPSGLLRRRHRPVRRDARLPADRRRPAPDLGLGADARDRHLDPARAATATHWIAPKCVVPIHWGTYTPITPKRGTPAWIENPFASLHRGARRARARRSAGPAASGRDADDRRCEDQATGPSADAATGGESTDGASGAHKANIANATSSSATTSESTLNPPIVITSSAPAAAPSATGTR